MVSTTKFVAVGNRRDKNLSDVTDPTEALNNLLDGLVGDGTFVSEDLNVIRGLQFENINSSVLSGLAGITVSVSDPNDPGGPGIIAEPLITIRDRIERARIVTGNIPAYAGGLGLNARFIQSGDINLGNPNATGDTIFNYNVNEVIENDYWEYGYFEHDVLIDKSFSDRYGGIQWTGYFSPILFDDSPSISYSTTGLLMVEMDPTDTNSWTPLVSMYDQNRDVTTSATTTGNTIQIVANHYKRVAVGDRLLANSLIRVTGVTASTISLTNDYPVASGSTVTFTKIVGSDSTSGSFSLPTVEPGNSIKIRISYYYPDNSLGVENKLLSFSYNNSNLPFVYLYAQKPEPAKSTEIRTFLNDAVSPYNNSFGNTGTSGSNYRTLDVGKTYINDYVPKNSLTAIRSLNATVSFTANSNIITVNASTANVNIGDNIIATSSPSSLPTKLQVKYKLGTNSLIVSNTIPVTGSQQVNFIDHKGLIDWFFATSSGSQVTVADTSNIQANNIVITGSTSSYVRITAVANSTTFTTSQNLGLTGTQPIYIYSEKGLTDKSKLNFCAGVFGSVLAANAEVGNTLLVTSNTGIAIGQVVQYSGSIVESPPTTVTGIAGTTVSLSGVNTITNRILTNSTITFAPAGTTVNKEICVLPLDTAPPFIGISDGLSTATRGLKSSALLTQDFAVETSNLVFEINNTNITTVSGTQQYDRKIRINNGQYFILGKV